MNYAVIFAGGTGSRMNTQTKPKQFLKLHSKEIIVYTLEQFQVHPDIEAISVVCLPEWIHHLKQLVKKYNLSKVRWISEGGKNGQQSIYSGLKAMENQMNSDAVVLIHDGVRPLIESDTISKVIAVTREKGCAITAAFSTETIMVVGDNDEIEESIDREKCRVVKAPQSFFYRDIMSSHKKALEEGIDNIIDSATLMKHYGYRLHIVEGKSSNIKITTPSDFYTFKALVDAEENSQVLGV